MKKEMLVILLCAAASFNSNAQAVTSRMVLLGTVYDHSNKPLAGVKVQLKKSGSTTTSHTNGRFRVFRPASDDVLVFSAEGYKEKSYLVGKTFPQVIKVRLQKRRTSRVQTKADVSAEVEQSGR